MTHPTPASDTPTTEECIKWLDNFRHINCPQRDATRAQLLAAQEVAEVLFKIRKPWPHEIDQLDDMTDKALAKWWKAGGQ